MINSKIRTLDLYNLIWSKPLSRIADELDLPTYLIKKICKEQKIPLPKPGHWKKLEYGKNVEMVKLPEFEGDEMVDLEKVRTEYEGTYQYKLLKTTEKIHEQNPKLSKVSKRLSNPNSLVMKARTDLNKKNSYKIDGNEQSIRTSSGYINIEVSKSNVARMLRFIDAFIKLTEERGHKIVVYDFTTKIIIHDESFLIKFREKCNRKAVKIHSWSSTILVPNGKLSLKIAKPYSTTEWVDCNSTIEQQLPKIVAALELRSVQEKVNQVALGKYRAEQKKSQKAREIQIAKERFEEEKFKILMQHSQEWQKANDLSSFIDHIDHKFGNAEPNNLLKEWLLWARSIQQSIDPLNTGHDEFLDQYVYESLEK